MTRSGLALSTRGTSVRWRSGESRSQLPEMVVFCMGEFWMCSERVASVAVWVVRYGDRLVMSTASLRDSFVDPALTASLRGLPRYETVLWTLPCNVITRPSSVYYKVVPRYKASLQTS